MQPRYYRPITADSRVPNLHTGPLLLDTHNGPCRHTAPALVLPVDVTLLHYVGNFHGHTQSPPHLGRQPYVLGGQIDLKAGLEIAFEKPGGKGLHALGVAGATLDCIEQRLRIHPGFDA